jgi:hypothetical protein
VNKVLRAILLVLALGGFLLFFSFNIQNVGPVQVVTVGFNPSPWLRWSRVRVRGIEQFTEDREINVLSWSAGGLAAGVLLLILRSRIKG